MAAFGQEADAQITRKSWTWMAEFGQIWTIAVQ
jgi:hypothetical protein